MCKILGGIILVDFDLEIKKLHPINIKEIELKRYAMDDNIKKSIILYNSAIGEMKKGNFELVIDDLRKALSYNEGFTEVYKLMGLCYVNMKEYKKAEKIFKKLSKDSMYSELANTYMESLDLKKSIPEAMTIKEAARNLSNNKNELSDKGGHLKRNLAVCLLLVMAVGGINYFYPEMVKGTLTKFKTGFQSVQQKFQSNNKIADSKEETNENLNEDKPLPDENSNEDKVLTEKTTVNTVSNDSQENSPKNVDNAKSEADNYKNVTVNMLIDAEKLLDSENYEKAATILISMKSRNFDNETKMKFDQLWQRLKPNPMWKIYNDGNSLYKKNKYAEALPKLLITTEIEPNLDIMPWITFQIGMCYKETKDYGNARIYFNKVKDNYPKSQYVSNSRRMLNEIG